MGGLVRRDILYAAAFELQQEARSVNDAVADTRSEEAAWIRYTDAAARGGGRLLFIVQLLVDALDWDNFHRVGHWRGTACAFVEAWQAAGWMEGRHPFPYQLAQSRDRSAIAGSAVWADWRNSGGAKRDSRARRRLRAAKDVAGVCGSTAAVPSRTFDYAPKGEDVAKEVVMLERALGGGGSLYVSDEAVATRLASEVAKAGGRHEGATANLVHDKIALSTLYNKSMAELEKAGLRSAVIDAVRAATERSRELGGAGD